jgi:hypothetical protein
VDPIAPASRRRRAAIGLGLVAALAAASCTDGDASGGAGASGTGSAVASGVADPAATISQPPIPTRIPVAPASERVDLAVPAFSHPTEITNRLFPVSDQASILFLGHVDGEPFRTEVTLLPYTRIVPWEGQRVETLVSQYNAFLGGSIEEVAYDYYAQADDGSVWYFGEDVFDFRDGAIVSTEGTWLAGRDGPAAMIMPADPQASDVYRTENAPGFVFEEVTVRSTDRTLDGPLGPIRGGMLADELHSDGKTEQKIFAPGYGEFYTAGGGDVEALALAVPTDAATEPLPGELTTMSKGAIDVYDAAAAGDWHAVRVSLDDVSRAWAAYGAGDVPRLIRPHVEVALRALNAAAASRDPRATRDAAIDVSRLGLDLQLRYRPVTEIDLARLDLWAAQMVSDAAADDFDAVSADSFAMDYVRDRLLKALDEQQLQRLNIELGAIQVAVIDRDVDEAGAAARRLRDEISAFRQG